MLVFYIIELVISCIFFVLLIPAFLLSLVAAMQVQAFGENGESFLYLSGLMRPQDVLLGVLLPDLVLTIIAAVALRRPGILLMAPLFPLMRILNSVICLMVLPRGLLRGIIGRVGQPGAARPRGGAELEEATAGAGITR